MLVPVPALSVKVLDPTVSGTAENVYAPVESEVAVAPVSTMVTAVLAEVTPLMTTVASVVEVPEMAVVPAALKKTTVGVVGAVAEPPPGAAGIVGVRPELITTSVSR